MTFRACLVFFQAHGAHAAAAELCAKAAALRPASLEAALAHVQQALALYW